MFTSQEICTLHHGCWTPPLHWWEGKATLIVQSEEEQLRLIQTIHDTSHLWRDNWMKDITGLKCTTKSILMWVWSFNTCMQILTVQSYDFATHECMYRSNLELHFSDRITNLTKLRQHFVLYMGRTWSMASARYGPCWPPLHQVGGSRATER